MVVSISLLACHRCRRWPPTWWPMVAANLGSCFGLVRFLDIQMQFRNHFPRAQLLPFVCNLGSHRNAPNLALLTIPINFLPTPLTMSNTTLGLSWMGLCPRFLLAPYSSIKPPGPFHLFLVFLDILFIFLFMIFFNSWSLGFNCFLPWK